MVCVYTLKISDLIFDDNVIRSIIEIVKLNKTRSNSSQTIFLSLSNILLSNKMKLEISKLDRKLTK